VTGEGRPADGSIRGFREAQDLLGVSSARISQIILLLHLSPRIQEAVLLGQSPASERALRAVAEEAEWPNQLSGSGETGS